MSSSSLQAHAIVGSQLGTANAGSANPGMKLTSMLGAKLAAVIGIVATVLCMPATAQAQLAAPAAGLPQRSAKPAADNSWPRDLAPWPQSAPSELRYREGMLPPPGYKLEQKRETELAYLGIAVFAGAYGSTVLVGLPWVTIERDMSGDSRAPGQVLIPVVGPLTGISQSTPGFMRALFLMDFAAQLTGVIMLSVGLLSPPTRTWVKTGSRSSSWALAPIPMGRSAPGMGIAGTF
jgi:hypothetical protein